MQHPNTGLNHVLWSLNISFADLTACASSCAQFPLFLAPGRRFRKQLHLSHALYLPQVRAPGWNGTGGALLLFCLLSRRCRVGVSYASSAEPCGRERGSAHVKLQGCLPGAWGKVGKRWSNYHIKSITIVQRYRVAEAGRDCRRSRSRNLSKQDWDF